MLCPETVVQCMGVITPIHSDDQPFRRLRRNCLKQAILLIDIIFLKKEIKN